MFTKIFQIIEKNWCVKKKETLIGKDFCKWVEEFDTGRGSYKEKGWKK